jgi:hypothetical protein
LVNDKPKVSDECLFVSSFSNDVNQHLIHASNQRIFSSNLFKNLLMIQANQEFLQRADPVIKRKNLRAV